ncbi:putative dehydrogenase [Bacillus sp. TS-2]|nr:putative dehydrogenase [Bacillus sp. TS-2]
MKVAVVTGANSGFGLLIAQKLLVANYIVVATMRDVRNQSELMLYAEKNRKALNLFVWQMDVTDETQIKKAVQAVEEKYGKVDVLINNAGYCQAGFLKDITLTQWKSQLDVNVTGVFIVTNLFLGLLKKSERAKVINISSVSGLIGLPGLSSYCSSKFALEGLSESMRWELKKEGIAVSLVEPGSYQTKIWNKSLKQVENQSESFNDFEKKIMEQARASSENAANPEEVASLVLTICKKTNPKLRYPIGKNSKFIYLAKRWLPSSWIDFILWKKLNS